MIVNGKMVVKKSEFQKGVWAGQPIRYPVEEKARLVPASVEHWVKTHAIPIDDSGAGINAPKVVANAAKEGAAIPPSLPQRPATCGAPAGAEWFGHMPYHSIGCDCGLRRAPDSGPGK